MSDARFRALERELYVDMKKRRGKKGTLVPARCGACGVAGRCDCELSRGHGER